MDRRRALRRLAVTLAALAAGWGSLAVADDLELAVKAAFLPKFAPFVTWPLRVMPANAPLVICVQGADPFGALLDQAAGGLQAAGHPLVIRRLARIEAGAGCQVAYLGGAAGQSVAQALQAVRGEAVLTVTDASRGPTAGAIHLVKRDGRVRFIIDTAQAEAGGLLVSSKLLALALAVKR